MAVKQFSVSEVLTASDTNTYLANSGLVYVTSATVGTGVSSVTVSNCFNSTYDNYRIVVSGIGLSGTSSFRMQLSNSTGGTYQQAGTYQIFGSATLSVYSPGLFVQWTDILPGDTTTNAGVVEMFQPYLTKATMATSSGIRVGASNTYYSFWNIDTNAVSNTGFTLGLITGGVTMTGGTITVYGYRKGN